MTVKEIVDLETAKTLDEIERKVNFIHDCRFVVIKIEDEERHETISENLKNLGIEVEDGYGYRLKGYIWLRWSFAKNRFETQLNYDGAGVDYNAPLYNSSDILTAGHFLKMKHVNSKIQKP